MTKTSVTLLRISKNSNMGRICKMISDKGSVQRPSIGFTIPLVDWCPITKRVKSTNPNSSIINNRIEQIVSDNPLPIVKYEDCIVSYMENEINTAYQNKSMKFNTYNKYLSITKGFRKAMRVRSISKITLNDVLNINLLQEVISIVSINSKPNGKNKLSIKNYLVVFSTYVKKWHLKNGGKPTEDFSYIHKLAKNNTPNHANYLTRNELEIFKNYTPSGFKDAYMQTISKSIFLSQYYIGGIRVSDALTLSNKQFKNDGIQIRMRKNGETRNYPYSYQLVLALKPLYKPVYETVVNELDMRSVLLPANIFASVIRSGLSINNYTLEDVNQKINLLKDSLVAEHKLLLEDMNELAKVIKNEIKNRFFELIMQQPEHFVFPFLDYEQFKDHLDKLSDLDKERCYAIHKATARYNSNLKVISKYLNFNKNISSHSARHSIALHLMEKGMTTSVIQDVLGQRSLASTAKYLAQRLPSNNILAGMNVIHG